MLYLQEKMQKKNTELFTRKDVVYMSNYTMITGFIEDIYEGKTSTGKEYLGIKFYTEDAHSNESFPEIRWWFSGPAAKEISQEKIERLFTFAGLEFSGAKPTTPKAALKHLAREEFVALEIQVTVQPNEYEGKIRAQYDLGWNDSGNPMGLVQSGLSKFNELREKRMAEIKSGGKKELDKTAAATPYDDDDVPF